MKAIHLADLHLGKIVNGFPMIADQRAVLAQVVQYADTHRPDCVFIAGDVYDKPVPSAEAVALLDDFLVQLAHRVPHTFVISGNHDSAERIAFGGRLMARCGVHLAPVYGGRVAPIPVPDAHGAVNVYMLPFVKPVQVRQLCDPAVETYSDAVRAAMAQMQPDPAARNVLITHQFVAGAQCSDSEEVSVGGTDAVDAALLAGFDYVALGHLAGHGALCRVAAVLLVFGSAVPQVDSVGGAGREGRLPRDAAAADAAAPDDGAARDIYEIDGHAFL